MIIRNFAEAQLKGRLHVSCRKNEQIVDLDHFAILPRSHAAHRTRGRFYMAPVSTPHDEKCPRRGSRLVHLEWHERVNAQEAQELWRCWICKSEFVTPVASDGTESSVAGITEPFFKNLLV